MQFLTENESEITPEVLAVLHMINSFNRDMNVVRANFDRMQGLLMKRR